MASLSSLWLTFHLKYICAKQFLIAWSDTHKWVRNNTTMKHMEWAFMTCKTVQIIKKHILRKKNKQLRWEWTQMYVQDVTEMQLSFAVTYLLEWYCKTESQFIVNLLTNESNSVSFPICGMNRGESGAEIKTWGGRLAFLCN